MNTYPDKNPGDKAAEEKNKTASHIYGILSDDGGALGREHIRRAHYDKFSSLDSFFEGYVEFEGDRSKKLLILIF